MTVSVEGAFSDDHYSTAYPPGIEHHFWNLARNTIIASTLQKYACQDPMLEIGCGTGVVVTDLRAKGFACWGSDLGIAKPAEGAEEFITLGQDCRTLDPEFRANIKTLLLLDVIEHVQDQVDFMASMRVAFPNAERLIVTVPARSELWSNYDDTYGHLRRYDRPMLTNDLKSAGFKPLSCDYFFHALYLPMRLLSKSGRSTDIQAPTGWKRVLHRLLAAFCISEANLLPGSIAGTSLIAVADIIHQRQ